MVFSWYLEIPMIRNLRKNIASHRTFSGYTHVFLQSFRSNAQISAERKILLFTLNSNSFGPNRTYHRKEHVAKYLPWIARVFFFCFFFWALTKCPAPFKTSSRRENAARWIQQTQRIARKKLVWLTSVEKMEGLDRIRSVRSTNSKCRVRSRIRSHKAPLDRTRPQTNLPLDGKTHCFRASLLSNVNRPILACEVHAYLIHMHLHESDLSEDTSEARS